MKKKALTLTVVANMTSNYDMASNRLFQHHSVYSSHLHSHNSLPDTDYCGILSHLRNFRTKSHPSGGISDRKTHYFENVVRVEEDRINLSQDLKEKLGEGYSCRKLFPCGFFAEATLSNAFDNISPFLIFTKIPLSS